MEYTQYINPIHNEIKINSALRDRRVYITGVITSDTSLEVCHLMRRIYDNDLKSNNQDKTITLILDVCYGGSVLAGNAIIGMIKFLQSKSYEVIGICQSCAFSMGIDILVNCTKRFGFVLSQYMLHQTQVGMEGELAEAERDVEFQKKQWQQSVKYYVENTKLTKEKIEEIYKYKINYFMLADEALENGIIQEII